MIQSQELLEILDAKSECLLEYASCMASVPDQLKALRVSKGLSQEALASELGATQGTVSRYESGHVALIKLLDWCEILDADLVVVPQEHADILGEVSTLVSSLDEAQRSELLTLVRTFSSAPSWAKSAATTVLLNASQNIGSKSA